MRSALDARTWKLCLLVPSVLLPLVAMGCGSSGRTSTVVQTWEHRPRFFTAEPGEEHSRFANVVWYERPRFFTKAEGEEHSRFERIWIDRPRLFTTKTETTSIPYSYGTTTYDTVQYQTVPVEHKIHHDIHHDHTNCDCPHHRKFKDSRTQINTTTYPSTASSAYSYGSQTHSNTTALNRDSRVMLTSDTMGRSVDSIISNWPQESRTAALDMQAKYGSPDSTRGDQLLWRDKGPWAEIVVFKTGTSHAYPDQHMDVLAQSVYFNVDADDMDRFSDFRGNIKVDHSRGLLTSKCKNEAMNFVAINLAHDILTGDKSVSDANNFLLDKARGGVINDAYGRDLQFEVGVDRADNFDRDENNVDRDVDVDGVDVDIDEE